MADTDELIARAAVYDELTDAFGVMNKALSKITKKHLKLGASIQKKWATELAANKKIITKIERLLKRKTFKKKKMGLKDLQKTLGLIKADLKKGKSSKGLSDLTADEIKAIEKLLIKLKSGFVQLEDAAQSTNNIAVDLYNVESVLAGQAGRIIHRAMEGIEKTFAAHDGPNPLPDGGKQPHERMESKKLQQRIDDFNNDTMAIREVDLFDDTFHTHIETIFLKMPKTPSPKGVDAARKLADTLNKIVTGIDI